jgi:hypothetical protein
MQHSNMTSPETQRRFPDGRDEMNLADFPISALQRQQPSDAHGRKIDRLEFEASRYDAPSRQRITQRVTLTTSAEDGLPTPADEHVILALLYVAKHGDNFATAVVKFAPSQLFEIMGWAPNGRSYDRLRTVLRRLKSLTIRYENAWWDAGGRAYEEEVATGIVGAYKIARQTSGPKTASTPLVSWVSWTQQFHDSLKKGNLKRLDLDVFFRLSTPTAQRIYRFLDKRFYTSPTVAMDLVEFACGHIGLTETKNVAILKRRLAPALAELETLRFIAPVAPTERYLKVKPGVWRIQFRPGDKNDEPAEAKAVAAVEAPAPISAAELAAEYYRLWDSSSPAAPGVRDVEVASEMLRLHGPDEAAAVLACLAQVTRNEWPECRSLSGAAQKYLGDALKVRRGQTRRESARQSAEAIRQREQEEAQRRQAEERRLQERWASLPAGEQEAIRRKVVDALDASAPEAFVRRLCLEEVGRRATT